MMMGTTSQNTEIDDDNHYSKQKMMMIIAIQNRGDDGDYHLKQRDYSEQDCIEQVYHQILRQVI